MTADGCVERDAYGVAPAYWLQDAEGVRVSPSFDLLAGQVDHVVDEDSFLSTLACGLPAEPGRTLLRDVNRLPPGHRLEVGDPPTVARWYETPRAQYDAPSVDGAALVTRFWELLLRCVEDRLTAHPGRDLALALSGGLDSIALAVAIREVAPRRPVLGLTLGVSGDDRDVEPAVARRAARHLGIEWEMIDVGADDPLAPAGLTPAWGLALPSSSSNREWAVRTDGAVTFYGYGGDAVLRGDPAFWRNRLRHGRWIQAAGDLVRTTLLHGLRPGFGLQRRLRRMPEPPACRYLLGRHAERARTYGSRRDPRTVRGPVLMEDPQWSSVFEDLLLQQPSATVCLPYFDPRLAAFNARTPTAPWFVGKEILRAALRGRVPDDVRLRPKTPLGFEPILTFGAQSVRSAIDELRSAGMAQWVDLPRLENDLRRGTCRFSEHAEIARIVSLARFRHRVGAIP